MENLHGSSGEKSEVSKYPSVILLLQKFPVQQQKEVFRFLEGLLTAMHSFFLQFRSLPSQQPEKGIK